MPKLVFFPKRLSPVLKLLVCFEFFIVGFSGCKNSTNSGSSAGSSTNCKQESGAYDFGCFPPNSAGLSQSSTATDKPQNVNVTTTDTTTANKVCSAQVSTREQIQTAKNYLDFLKQMRLNLQADETSLPKTPFEAAQRCNQSATQPIEICQVYRDHLASTFEGSPLSGCNQEQLAKISELSSTYDITHKIESPKLQNALLRAFGFLKENTYVTASLQEFFERRKPRLEEARNWFENVSKKVEAFAEQPNYSEKCAKGVRAFVNYQSGDDLDRKTVVLCPDFLADDNVLDMAATLLHEAQHTDKNSGVGWKIGKYVDSKMTLFKTKFEDIYSKIFAPAGEIDGVDSTYSNTMKNLGGFVHSNCLTDTFGEGVLACDPYFADYYVRETSLANSPLVNPGAYSFDVFFYERIARDTGITQYEVTSDDALGKLAELSSASQARTYDPKYAKMPFEGIKWGCDEGYIIHLTRFQKWYNALGEGTDRISRGALPETFAHAYDVMLKWQSCLIADREVIKRDTTK